MTPEEELRAENERTRGESRREAATFRKENEQLRAHIAELQVLADFAEMLDEARPEPPKWMSPARPVNSHATLMLLQSDQHFDEVVASEEMDGINAYDRTIATKRLEKWCKNVVKLSRHYLSGVTYDGAILMLGGDGFSGVIHEELKETNADTLFGSLLYWLEQEAAAIDLLAEEYKKVHIVGVPGNHPRLSRKPRMKLRAKDNMDWLFCKLLERQFRGDRRVTFQIPEAADAWFEVYGRGQLLTHGDQVTGGGGIGGIWPPIMRLRARKTTVHMATGKPFETLWMGHWHQLIQTGHMVVNGSIKGYDEYAKLNNFPPEPAQQAMAVMTPENGITWQAPVFCQDRQKEGW